VEKVLPYQTFIREGIPTQWHNQFFVYSIFLFYVLVRTPCGPSWTKLDQAGTSWTKLDQAGTSCTKLVQAKNAEADKIFYFFILNQINL
jgi:hypothetical protein